MRKRRDHERTAGPASDMDPDRRNLFAVSPNSMGIRLMGLEHLPGSQYPRFVIRSLFSVMPIPFDNAYARLPERFFAPQKPHPVAAPQLIRTNDALAVELGIDPAWLASADGLAAVSGNAVPPGAQPIAQAYAGHQFAHFVPQLGDGRAILLGEVVDSQGRRRDIQLKGAGRTAWSRGGDGRSALGPVMREYIVSEAMHALGVPTTRALAAVSTGENVQRETVLPGGIFTRVAASHIRVGTFQYFAAQEDTDARRQLADHVIARHYPAAAEAAQPYLALLEAVVSAQCDLINRWLPLGFIHGVMNTDNCAISGETIDYGPCAFMDTFHPQCVFSSIDRGARYAWGNQPSIAQWNLTRFAETLLPLLDPDHDRALGIAEAALAKFPGHFHAGYLAAFRAKLGLADANDASTAFIKSTLETLAAQHVDFTLFFRHLTRIARGDEATELVSLFRESSAATTWLQAWRDITPADLPLETMQGANPVLIPRNHRIEQAIQAGYRDDFAPFHRLVEALARPFAENGDCTDLEQPPTPEEQITATFCGT